MCKNPTIFDKYCIFAASIDITEMSISLSFVNPTTAVNVNTGIFNNVATNVFLNYDDSGMKASINDKASEVSFGGWRNNILSGNGKNPCPNTSYFEWLHQEYLPYLTGLDYYASFTPEESLIFNTADFLATRCYIMDRNWQPAIDWYENRISRNKTQVETSIRRKQVSPVSHITPNLKPHP
jgi:hypothetical protein